MQPDTTGASPVVEARAVRHDLFALLKLAGPVALSRLGIMVMGLTDAIVVGRHSATQLSYQALGWAPTAVVLTTSIGLLMGVQVMTARAMGEGRPEATGAVLRRGVVYAFWVGLLLSIVTAGLGPTFLHVLGLDPVLADAAGHVLVVFSLSLIPNLVATAGSIWLEGLARPLPGVVAMWVANIANLALNLVFVPHGGAVGSAWATFGARLVLVAGVFGYIAWMRDARALGVFDKPAPDREAGVALRKVGYGAGASYFVESGAFGAMSVVAGWVGGMAVAAWAIVLNVSAIIFMIPLGVAVAAGVLVGTAYGAQDRRGAARAGWLGLGVAAAFGMLVAAIVLFGNRLIAGAYSHEPALTDLAAPALLLACLFFAADGMQVVAAQALRARGDILVPTIMHITSYAVVMTPLAWLLALPMGLGLNGVVWAVVAASFLAAGLLCSRLWLLGRRA